MRQSLLATAVVLALALTGCSGGEPTEAQMDEGFRHFLETIGGKAALESLHLAKVKKIGCTKSDKGGFACDYQGPMGPGRGRFVKADTGWQMFPEQ